MPNLPALVTLVISFGGILLFIARKWPELQAMEILPLSIDRKPFKKRAKERMSGLNPAANLHTEKFLKNVLLKAKVLFKKGEKRADHYLRRVSHSEKFKDDYWGRMKKD
ncbi:MAG: hypothetical protein U9Q96_01690 [Patescibacteria group bacterium]|nr:hypothetical protein [Patescibacteria group bacterium]